MEPAEFDFGITDDGTGPISLAAPQSTVVFGSELFANAVFQLLLFALSPPSRTHGPFVKAVLSIFAMVVFADIFSMP